jgi:hypothetical protein
MHTDKKQQQMNYNHGPQNCYCFFFLNMSGSNSIHGGRNGDKEMTFTVASERARLIFGAMSLKRWSQKLVGSVRYQLAVEGAKEVIFKLEQAQDTCLLSTEELDLRTELKFKCLGLASLAHTIARQRSWILHLKEGDSNTRYFQPQACHRSRKSFIDRRVHPG